MTYSMPWRLMPYVRFFARDMFSVLATKGVGMLNKRTSQRRSPSQWVYVAGGLVLIACVAGVLLWRNRELQTTSVPATVQVRRTTFRQTVTGSGTLAPIRTATVTFGTAGQVQTVLVHVGDHVRRGQLLMRLDDQGAQLALQQAQADLDQRIAALAETQTISATESDVAEAQANVVIAKAQLQAAQASAAADTRSGTSTVALAQTKQETTQQGDVPADLQAAYLKTQEAEIALEQTRDSASVTKTNAQIALNAAVDSLKAAQQKYSDAYWLNEEVRRTKRDPNTLKNNEQPDSGKLTDNQVRAYQQALDDARLAVQQAESAVQAAQVAYDLARQQEADAVRSAEEVVDDARKNEETTRAGSIRASLASAQDDVVQNQAALAKQQASNAASIASARGNLLIAQAKLAAAQNPSAPSTSAIASAQALVVEGRANLFTAQQAISATQVFAPFDATVSAVSVAPGATVAAGASALTLMDIGRLTVEVALGENDIVQVVPGLAVSLQPEALAETVLSGTVQTLPISPTFPYGAPSYPVRVEVSHIPPAVRLGMTVDISITTLIHPDALVVPLEAVQGEGATATVQRLTNTETTTVPVTLGQQNEFEVEVLGGVNAGDTLVLPQSETDSSAANGQSQSGGLFGGGEPGGGPPPP